MLTGAAMLANDGARSGANDAPKISLEDPVVLGDQVLLLAVSVVGVQRCRA